MNKQLLAGALSTLLLIAGVCVHSSALAASTFIPTSITTAPQDGGSVYKFKEAGIQFTVPAGWQVEKDKDGDVTVSKLEGDNLALILFSIAPPEVSTLTFDQQLKVLSESVLSGTKNDFKGLKLANPTKGTQNGIPITSQVFAGKQKGVDMVGMLVLISTDKPVFMYLQGTAKKSERLDKETHRVLDSVKKIE